MMGHFKMVSDAHLILELAPQGDQMDFMDESPNNLQRYDYLGQDHERMEVMRLFMHAADLNNPTKPTKLSRQWTERVMNEFFEQGDEEKRLGKTIQTFTALTNCWYHKYFLSPIFLLSHRTTSIPIL